MVLSVCAFAALTLGVGSCSTAATSTVSATGKTLTIYASAPPSAQAPADVLDAEKLAFQQFAQNGAKVGKYGVRLVTLTGSKLSDNARTAIENSSVIAYIGELSPGDSADTVGITNAEDVLQVSPTDTALALTQKSQAVSGSPGDYYESAKTYGRTFARVVPSTAQEAKAQVQEMSKLGVHKLYITDDGSDYGAAIAAALKADAGSSLSAVQGPPTASAFSSSGADALFYGGTSASAPAAARLFGNVGEQHGPGVKLFAPSALSSPAFAASFGPANLHLYVSSPGFMPSDLPAAGKQFAASFKSAYGHAPDVQAIFGYEAVKAVLAVLSEAGASANDRSTVVRDFFAIRSRSSAIGTYSINSSGDINIAPFVFSRFRDGKLVPFAQLQR